LNKEKIIAAMMKYEGFEFEEANMAYIQRKKMPPTAFCGPDRTYLACDKETIKEAFVRLSTFASRLAPATKATILRALCKRAKEHNVETSFCKDGKCVYTEETVTVDWFESQPEVQKIFEEAAGLWIAGAIKKKGALRAQLGIKEGEKIPKSFLVAVKNAEIGSTVSFRGKKIKVTAQLKKRAVLALTLGKVKPKSKK